MTRHAGENKCLLKGATFESVISAAQGARLERDSKMKLSPAELSVLTVALESLDPVRILLWEFDDYPKRSDKTPFIEELLKRLWSEEAAQ